MLSAALLLFAVWYILTALFFARREGVRLRTLFGPGVAVWWGVSGSVFLLFCLLTAVAGVIANYIVAFIAYLIYVLLLLIFAFPASVRLPAILSRLFRRRRFRRLSVGFPDIFIVHRIHFLNISLFLPNSKGRAFPGRVQEAP